MSGKGVGRIDWRRRRHGHHGLRRLHEADRQRTAAYNLGRGRLTLVVRERIARGARVQARKLRKERLGTPAAQINAAMGYLYVGTYDGKQPRWRPMRLLSDEEPPIRNYPQSALRPAPGGHDATLA